MARPQASDYDAKRAYIRFHAATCFAEVGYPSASMADIAQASSVSKAGLYHYYTSKEAVLFDVLDTYVRALVVLSNDALNRHTDSRQALFDLIRSLLSTYAIGHHQHRVLVTDTQYLSLSLREQVLTHQRHLVHLMGAALQAVYPQRIPSSKASAYAMMVFGMLNWTFTWFKGHGSITYVEYAQQVIATLDTGLSSQSAICSV